MKIKYRILDIPNHGYNYGLSFGEKLKWKNYLYIHDVTIDKFLEYDPPCKECLVQATCLRNSTNIVTEYSKYIYLEMCDRLKFFITFDERFYK